MTAPPYAAGNVGHLSAHNHAATAWANVLDFGAVGDGVTDDTNAVQAAVAAVGAGGRVLFPRGTFLFDGIVVPAGVSLDIEGAGVRATTLKSRTGLALFTVGDGVTNTDGFRLSRLRLTSAVADMPYQIGLVTLIFVRSFVIDQVDALITGTGTALRLDTSYTGVISGGTWDVGKYGVAWETCGDARPTEQCDTVAFRGTVVFGSFGHVHRNTNSGNWHTVTYDGAKFVDRTSYSGHNRRETTLSAAAAAGAGSVTVASATGWVIGDSIALGHGEVFEVNRVTGVAGAVLSLARPLRSAHPIGDPALYGGVAIAFGGNTYTVSIEGGCHFESHAVAFWHGQTTGATLRGLTIDGAYSAAAELVRTYGFLTDAVIRNLAAFGDATINDNTLFNVISSTGVGRLAVVGPIVPLSVVSGSVAVTYVRGVGTGVAHEYPAVSSGIIARTVRVNTADQGNPVEIFYGSGTERFRRDHAGKMTWGTDVTLYRGAADVLQTDDSLKTGASVTASRPAAATVGAGAQWYDTTLGKPIWSNGTVWKDAAGTTV